MTTMGLTTASPWTIISSIIGWTYFLSWSFSFYPQTILNFRRKSVQGLSIDFLYYNVFGFLCYSIFNLAFFFSKEIQEEYRHRHGDNDNLVRANDVLFAVHAFLISSLTLWQTFIYKSDQKLSFPARLVLLTFIVFTMAAIGTVYEGYTKWIDVLYFLSYIKLVISFIKYIPQLWMNYRRKSTIGWSIHNILLDFTGGILSVAQLVLDAAISGDWSGITGDPVKFGLGFVAIVFDLLFMGQHFILYRERYDYYLANDDSERQALLQHDRS
ncbi:PQ loop repeat-domain-containing protein [Chlamydoabsidia padenii]|nr:PQ loop repeat-domain-containing protein [Chlamydoabsidia padenii]